MRTWKIIEMGEDFFPEDVIALICPNCGQDAEMPLQEWIGNPIIAAIGISVIFDRPGNPPHNITPKTIQCRKCLSKFTSDTL